MLFSSGPAAFRNLGATLTVAFNGRTQTIEVDLISDASTARAGLKPVPDLPPAPNNVDEQVVRTPAAQLYRLFKAFYDASQPQEQDKKCPQPEPSPGFLSALNGLSYDIHLGEAGEDVLSIEQAGGTLTLGLKNKGQRPLTMTVWPIADIAYLSTQEKAAHGQLVTSLGMLLRAN